MTMGHTQAQVYASGFQVLPTCYCVAPLTPPPPAAKHRGTAMCEGQLCAYVHVCIWVRVWQLDVNTKYLSPLYVLR